MSAENAHFLNGDPENCNEHIDTGGEARQINIITQIENLYQDNRELGEGLIVICGTRWDKKHLCLVTLVLFMFFVLTGLIVVAVRFSSGLHHDVDKSMPNSLQPEKQACPLGKYGPLCSQTCANCFNITCNSVTGECLHGCAIGWRGLNCDTGCPRGKHGPSCSHPCGHCFNITCNSVTGECLHGCAMGWRGLNCDTEYRPGTYGVACSEKCRNCFNDTCDLGTGKCPQAENVAGSAAGGISPIVFVSCVVLVTVIIVVLKILIKGMVKERRERKIKLRTPRVWIIASADKINVNNSKNP